ncbi:MAG: hypothetical protein K8S99_10375 [Planctomycetes bacterium]|nr:hypothetical protein [Planctomycetota bacterium]
MDLLFIVVFGVFTLIPLTLVVWLLVFAARRATRAINQCKACGYDLHSLGDRRECPECGRPFQVNQNGDVVS